MNKPAPSSQLSHTGIRHHWSFIRVGLWASLATLFALLIVGIWSYQQTNQLVHQAQERTGTALANGLASAVEENLIIRNFAQLEVQLLQFMANEQLQAAVVTDAQGVILSEVHRDPATGNAKVIYSNSGKTLPGLKSTRTLDTNTLEIVQPSGSTSNVGWIKLQITITSDTALLEGIHQQLSLILGLSAIIMLVIVGFSLRNTYSRVRTSQNEMEALNDSLHTAAFFDALTQLPNRHLLKDRLQQALALAARSHNQVAICYLDLDGFKAINDNYGHQAGDTLLIEVAKRLTLSLRQHDTVARVGGDEFVLLITELHAPADCHVLLDRLLIDLTQPIDIGDGHWVTLTASIGVSLSHTHGVDPTTLLLLADQAMYKSKTNGKNQWQVYTKPLQDNALNSEINRKHATTTMDLETRSSKAL